VARLLVQPAEKGPNVQATEVTTDSECWSRLQQDYVFLSDPVSKIFEKPDLESLFNFGSSRSLCDHILSKNMDKFRFDR